MSKGKDSLFKEFIPTTDPTKKIVSDFARAKIGENSKRLWDEGHFDGLRLTQEDAIQRCIDVHGDKYDYSKVEYVNAKTRVTVICPKHGEFNTFPSNFFRGVGCPRCPQRNKGSIHFTTEEVIEQFKEIHGDKYDYSKFEYLGSQKKSVVICPFHGEWEVSFTNHKKTGCPSCANETPLDVQLIVDLLCDGKTPEEIGSQIGASPTTIRKRIRRLKKLGTLSQFLKGREIPSRRGQKIREEVDTTEMRRLYEQGLSVSQIAKRLNTTFYKVKSRNPDFKLNEPVGGKKKKS